jgi:hypothetical protein
MIECFFPSHTTWQKFIPAESKQDVMRKLQEQQEKKTVKRGGSCMLDRYGGAAHDGRGVEDAPDPKESLCSSTKITGKKLTNTH